MWRSSATGHCAWRSSCTFRCWTFLQPGWDSTYEPREASPFIRYLMHVGPLAGLFGAKLIAVSLGGFCVWRQRFRVMQLINYFFAALVTWNIAILLLLLR